MANIPLKTLTLPGLPNTYTIPDIDIDDTLSVEGDAADAKAVGDELGGVKSGIGNVKNEVISVAGVVEEMECGLTEDVKTALLACFGHVAWAGQDGQNYYDALEAALNAIHNLTSITAVFAQGSATIYDTDELYGLKQYLTVTAAYSDGTTKEVNNYTLSGNLVAGTSTITVAYNRKVATFNVAVTHQVKTLTSISATFDTSVDITTDNVLDDLRPYLTVRATYSDGSTAIITNYTLSGNLNAGTNTITVSYNEKTDTFTVTVTQAEATLQSISATFVQGTAVIYTDSSLDDLKPYLTVTANYSDGTTQTVANYTLSGTLAVGTSTITASYNGKTDTFTVNVSSIPSNILYEWDFTQGLTDLQQGKTATLSNETSSTPPVQDSQGVHFNAYGQAVILFSRSEMTIEQLAGKTIQVDVASFVPDASIAGKHTRFLMFLTDDNKYGPGLIYFGTSSGTNGWNVYAGSTNGWGNVADFGYIGQRNAISGHTVSVYITPDYKLRLYIDSELKGTSSVAMPSNYAALHIGNTSQISNGATFFNALVTGIRICNGEVA